MKINYNNTFCGVKHITRFEHSVLHGLSSSGPQPPSRPAPHTHARPKELCKKKWKNCRSQREREWMMPGTQGLPDARWLSHMCASVDRACTGSSLMRPNADKRGKWTQAPIPNDKAICNWYLLEHEKLVCFTGGILTTLKGGFIPSSRWPT